MWRANLFVHASRVETFGIVLAEALATGLNVISTRCGGPNDILAGGGGVLVPPDNVNALREAMEAGWREAPHLPEACRRHAVERFSSEVVTKKLGDVYREALTTS
jgi:glycosyltransferase involved in cell wall biosynthesis